MNEMLRNSPIFFDKQPIQSEIRDAWRVALKYSREGKGPHLVDLSHKPKWDVQSSAIDAIQPFGIEMPKAPGQCILANGIMICRMNATQGLILMLGQEQSDQPKTPEFTDITEGQLLLALAGQNLFSITEKLTSMDLQDPQKPSLYLFQGPFAHVPCQIVVMRKDTTNCLLLLSCSRGYAKDMVETVLAAGKEIGLRPAGEIAFNI